MTLEVCPVCPSVQVFKVFSTACGVRPCDGNKTSGITFRALVQYMQLLAVVIRSPKALYAKLPFRGDVG
jgi:hypothetical protein